MHRLTLLFLIGFSTTINAQRFKDVTITTEKLTEHIYMLKGAGGNVGVSAGEDGVFVIDDQFAELTDKILAVIKDISDKPIHYVVNTHWHGDHTGGNTNMTHQGVKIIAHDNVRKRLEETPKRDNTMRSKEALPVITFNDKLSVYMNGEQVYIFHVAHAHTDGDSLLYFTKSNVLHTGDTYFQGWYPYIDLNSGGSVNGYIAAVKKGLSLINNDTIIIPGHGNISNKKEYTTYLNMLETLKTTILSEIKKGQTEEQVATNSELTKTFDDLGYSWNFINSEKIRRTFYKSLK
ncbi:MBL fold metallo-hydrolase [Pontimicrobium sp. IMCC45349]|uniref:MBL fold metallo-hydrolase n=1 Tax=Pontimicrobium sp. IMCC45349 TaxID=3391574 RepID=UPI0039A383EC